MVGHRIAPRWDWYMLVEYNPLLSIVRMTNTGECWLNEKRYQIMVNDGRCICIIELYINFPSFPETYFVVYPCLSMIYYANVLWKSWEWHEMTTIFPIIYHGNTVSPSFTMVPMVPHALSSKNHPVGYPTMAPSTLLGEFHTTHAEPNRGTTRRGRNSPGMCGRWGEVECGNWSSS